MENPNYDFGIIKRWLFIKKLYNVLQLRNQQSLSNIKYMPKTN